MGVYNAGVSVQFPNSLAYDGALPPTSYTDLDLSSIVGAHQCLVLLKVYKDSANNRYYKFRKNGEAANVGPGGTTYVDQVSTNIGYQLVVTDTAGIIEWLAEAQEQVKVYVECFAYV